MKSLSQSINEAIDQKSYIKLDAMYKVAEKLGAKNLKKTEEHNFTFTNHSNDLIEMNAGQYDGEVDLYMPKGIPTPFSRGSSDKFIEYVISLKFDTSGKDGIAKLTDAIKTIKADKYLEKWSLKWFPEDTEPPTHKTRK